MAKQVVLDLSVSDVHVPGAMPGYDAGYPDAAPRGRKQKHAALVVVRKPTGHVLTVSRPEPPHEMAIPGGLVEKGETPEQAAQRELREECGIECGPLQHVCDMTSPTDGRPVHVFHAPSWSGEPSAAEEGTKIDWLMPQQLMAQAKLYKPSVQHIMNAGGLHMPLEPTRTASDRRTMAEISTKTRNALPDSSFALPSKRKYPLERTPGVLDPNHVRNAASRLSGAKKKGKITDADYATAHANILKAEKKLGIETTTEASDTAASRGRMHHFQISADLAHGGSLNIQHAALTDAGGVAYMPPRPIVQVKQ